MTPSNELDKKHRNDPFYMTPEQGTSEEEKKDDDHPILSLDVPKLKVTDMDTTATKKDTDLQQQSTPKSNTSSRRLMGPGGKEAAAPVPMALYHEDKLEDEKEGQAISVAHSASTVAVANKTKRKSNFGISHFGINVDILQEKVKPSSSHSPQDEATKEEFDDIPLRKTWSSSSLKKEKTWIKANPTDTVLELKSSNNRRRSSVVCEQGLEIIAMGRLRTIGDDGTFSDDEDDCDGASTGSGKNDTATDGSSTRKSEDADSASSHHGLSVPYKSDNFVDVATFRP
jgi:hypothetical protein